MTPIRAGAVPAVKVMMHVSLPALLIKLGGCTLGVTSCVCLSVSLLCLSCVCVYLCLFSLSHLHMHVCDGSVPGGQNRL